MDGNPTGSYNLLSDPAPVQSVNPKQFTPEFDRLVYFMGYVASGLAAHPEGANLHPNAFANICFENATAMCSVLEQKYLGSQAIGIPDPE